MDAVSDSVLSTLGYDTDDPEVQGACEDARLHMDLIDTLVNARDDQGLSQSDVARLMNTTQSAISNFERLGGDPKLSTIMRYARAVGVRVRHTVLADEHSTAAPVTTRVASYTDTAADDEVPAAVEGQWQPVSSRAGLSIA